MEREEPSPWMPKSEAGNTPDKALWGARFPNTPPGGLPPDAGRRPRRNG
jgi:hypothetical protein